MSELGFREHGGQPRGWDFPIAWFALVALVLIASSDGRGLPDFDSSRELGEANLRLVVELTEAGVALSVSEEKERGSLRQSPPARRALHEGRGVWIGNLGSGISNKELGRAARAIVEDARLSRGASSSRVHIEIRRESGVGWVSGKATERALEEGLSPRPHFEAPSELQIAWNMAGERGKATPPGK